MNERIKFIATYLEGEENFSDLCDFFEISRKTGYKWVERYEEGGVERLTDLSRAPHSHPNQVGEEVREALLSVRKKHPRWGPKKLVAVVARHHPQLELPATSTVGEILQREGLVHPRKRRRVSSPYAERLIDYGAPNDLWCADFKGHFATGEERCHPLTITDGFSRYLLTCKAQPRPFYCLTRDSFERAFREYGLPLTIRTDNGAPFSTLAPGGLSLLAIWWIRLGIRPERIMPGRPDQNGQHERMHETLKAETAKPPCGSISAQQRAFNRFRVEYNEERPHEALGQEVPAKFYEKSPRRYPNKLPEPVYPDHFELERTYPNGVISFQKTQWFISGCLRGEVIGLEETADGCWKAYFGPIQLGVLDLRDARARGNRNFGYMIRHDGELPYDRRRKHNRPPR
jgi:transposase InsO family protein